VIVTEYVPGAAVPALTVRTDEPPAGTEAGLKPADAPAGNPDTLSATDSAVPEVTAVLTVDVPDEPCTNDSEEGAALIEKSLGPQLGNLNEAMRVFQLKVPFAGMYSLTYQNVHSSTGSTSIAE
jgi:hypothetical protein